MTKEQLQDRLVLLKANKDQFIANANAANGAIAEAEYWLAKLIEAEKPLEE